MKRYTIHGVAASHGEELKGQPYTAYPDENGLWVKWEDVEPFWEAMLKMNPSQFCGLIQKLIGRGKVIDSADGNKAKIIF